MNFFEKEHFSFVNELENKVKQIIVEELKKFPSIKSLECSIKYNDFLFFSKINDTDISIILAGTTSLERLKLELLNQMSFKSFLLEIDLKEDIFFDFLERIINILSIVNLHVVLKIVENYKNPGAI